MTRLSWDNLPRTYETGVDQAVLYFLETESVAWSGITNVVEQISSSSGGPRYFDGIAYDIEQKISDYAATVEAYVFPYMLEDHVLGLTDGRTLVAEKEETRPFGFTYRTRKGDGYLLHLVYNVTATIDTVSQNTISNPIAVVPFSFTFYTTPVDVPGARPTSHLIVDSEEASEGSLFLMEKLLYGSDSSSPRFPTATEVVSLMSSG